MSAVSVPRLVRSWKERWDPKAPLVFLRHRKLGLAGVDTVKPGDPVTEEMRKALGNRLRVWWESKFVGRADKVIRKGEPKSAPVSPAPRPNAPHKKKG